MNNQPQQTAPVDNASTLGLNPYDRINTAAAEGHPLGRQEGHYYVAAAEASDATPRADRRSEGLTGDMLDQLLRGRWMEGHRLGRQEGHELAKARYTHVFNEGFVTGNDRGSAQMAKKLVGLLHQPLDQVLHELEDIGKRSGSTEIKNACARSTATLGRLVEILAEQLVGSSEFNVRG